MAYTCGLEYTLLTCATCGRDVNADEETMTKLDGEWQCGECRESCPGCMEHITDDTIPSYGVVVNFRDYLLPGQRVTMHADCAATTFLRYLDPHFDLDHTTRGEIAAAVELHYAEALVLAKYPEAVCIEKNGWWYVCKRMTMDFHKSNVIQWGRSEREAWIDAGKEVRNAASAA